MISVLSWFSFSSELFGFHEFEWTLPVVNDIQLWSMWWDRLQSVIYFPCISWGLALCPIWTKFHDLLRIEYILLFCKYLLGPFGLWCHLTPVFPSLVFVCLMCLLVKVGYRCHPLSLCQKQCYISYSSSYLMSLCFIHKCLGLQYTL